MSLNQAYAFWTSTIDASTEDTFRVADESRRRLLRGILYSRWLVKTYHYVGIGVVTLFTLLHVSRLLQRRYRHRSREITSRSTQHAYHSDDEATTNSRDSIATSQAKDIDEYSYLLETTHSSRRIATRKRIWRSLNAVGAYQLPNIPLINRVSPPLSAIVFLLFLYGLNTFYTVYNMAVDIGAVFIWADRAGLVFVANLPWLYLLGAKNQPISILTGYSYERVNFAHRRLGEVICLQGFLHSLLMFVGWYRELLPLGWGLLRFVSDPTILIGLLALVCYEILLVTSQPWFRKLWYETFLGLHVVLQFGGLIFLYLHYPPCRIYTVISIVIFSIDRLIFRLTLKSYTTSADLMVMEDGGTILLSADWPITYSIDTIVRKLSRSAKSGWRSSQHVFLTIPSMGIRHSLQAHPFTIASAAPTIEQSHAWLNLIIRAHDGFSRDLLHFAKTHHSTNIRIDGPYGSLHALDMLHDSDISLVVAGGSGVAVAYPLIWSLLHDPPTADRSRSSRRTCLIWIVHEASHISWIGRERLKELEEVGLMLYLPTPTSQGGRPDMDLLTTQVLREAIAQVAVHDPRIGVVVSGPDGMNRVVRNVCAREAWKGNNIEVCVEKYGW